MSYSRLQGRNAKCKMINAKCKSKNLRFYIFNFAFCIFRFSFYFPIKMAYSGHTIEKASHERNRRGLVLLLPCRR